MEDGFRLLERQCEKRIIIGATLGSALALIAGAKLPVDAIVAISPHYDLEAYAKTVQLNLPNPIGRLLKVGKRTILKPASLPNLLPQDDTSHLSYSTIPTRTIAEIELLLSEMKRVLPRVHVPALLMHTDAKDDASSETVMKILDQLGTKRVKIVQLKAQGSETSLQLERERITEAITRFVTSQPGFQQ
jgi:esterase/lipase